MALVNFNAATVLLGAFNKAFEMMLKSAVELSEMEDDLSCLKKMKEFCGLCSHLYYIDRWIFASFFAAQDDIFYKPLDDPDVKAVQAVTAEYSLGDDDATVLKDV